LRKSSFEPVCKAQQPSFRPPERCNASILTFIVMPRIDNKSALMNGFVGSKGWLPICNSKHGRLPPPSTNGEPLLHIEVEVDVLGLLGTGDNDAFLGPLTKFLVGECC